MAVAKLLHVDRALLLFLPLCGALTLEGSASSYARFPRWYQAFENVLSVEMKSRTGDGLLLYTDNGGRGNFYEISLYESCVQLTWRVGRPEAGPTGVHNLRNCHVRTNDGRWHKVVLYHFWETVRLEVDDHRVSKTLQQQDFVFTDYDHAGDVFIGGLPVDYDSSSLSFPFAKALSRFQGSLRNLIYRTLPYGVTAPSMLQWQGVRASDTDYCVLSDYCTAWPTACYSSDTGPACNCPNDRSGARCEIENTPNEVTVMGNEAFGFDRLTSRNGMMSRRQFVTLEFKTRKSSGTLFVYGNEQENVWISLYQGAVTVVSKTHGAEQDARVVPFKSNLSDQKLGFSDGHWHLLSFSRTLNQINLTVDDVFSNVRDTATEHVLLTEFAFAGGSPRWNYTDRYNRRQNFSGCLRKVRFEADGRSIDLVSELSLRGGLSRVVGDNVGRSCQSSFSAEAITFLSSDGYLNASGWHGGISGQVGFRFRTKEPNGLLLYVGPSKPGSGNFFAVEMFNGHLYLSIDLGSGTLRLQLDRTPVNDGRWHAVNIHRNARTGSSSVDDWHVDFSTPGKERMLDTGIFMQIGAVPWNSPDLPPSVWTATLRQGFAGCLKDFTVDGILLDLIGLLPMLKEQSVEVGCYDMLPQCRDHSCQNEGQCIESWNGYRCDCSSTFYSGDRCEQSMFTAKFGKHSVLLAHFAYALRTEVDDIRLKFRSQSANGLLLIACDHNSQRCIGLQLVNWQLECFIVWQGIFQNIQWSERLEENEWQAASIKRRMDKVYAEINGRTLEPKMLAMTSVRLHYDFISVGSLGKDRANISWTNGKYPSLEERGFAGSISDLAFDGIDVLNLAWRQKLGDNSFLPSMLSNIVSTNVQFSADEELVTTFDNGGYALLDVAKIEPDVVGILQVSFSIRTSKADGVLMYRHGNERIFRLLELRRGRIAYRFNVNDNQEALMSNLSYPLNDMSWHSVLVKEYSHGAVEITVDNVTSTKNWSTEEPEILRYGRSFRLGSPSVDVLERLQMDDLKPLVGFEGCLTSVQINGMPKRLLRDSISFQHLHQGCSAQCEGEMDCLSNSECSLAGDHSYCLNNSTVAYRFGPQPGAIILSMNSSNEVHALPDRVVIGLVTYQPDAVVFQIVDKLAARNFQIELEDGYCAVTYKDRYSKSRVEERTVKISDGLYHAIKFQRSQLDLSLTVDSGDSVVQKMKGHLIMSERGQSESWLLALGAGIANMKPTSRRRRSEQHLLNNAYYGVMSDVLVNELRVLEMAASSDPRVLFVGDVKRHYFNGVLPEDVETKTSFSGEVSEQSDRAWEDHELATHSIDGANELQDELFTSGEGETVECDNVLDDEDCSAEPNENELITPVLSTVELPIIASATESSNGSTNGYTPSEAALANENEQGITQTPFSLLENDGSSLHHVTSLPSSISIPFSVDQIEYSTSTPNRAQETGNRPVVANEPAKASSTPVAPWMFPRTSVIAGVSLALIIAIASIVFYVFKCRRNSSASDSTEYKSITADAYDEKSPRSALLSDCFSDDTIGLRYGVAESTEAKAVKEWYV
uniref:EGF-like domain-containing protein n=1 Tax=Trichuris muris TaxID=70415 RepID=A0A5S6QVV7_TRIMR